MDEKQTLLLGVLAAAGCAAASYSSRSHRCLRISSFSSRASAMLLAWAPSIDSAVCGNALAQCQMRPNERSCSPAILACQERPEPPAGASQGERRAQPHGPDGTSAAAIQDQVVDLVHQHIRQKVQARVVHGRVRVLTDVVGRNAFSYCFRIVYTESPGAWGFGLAGSGRAPQAAATMQIMGHHSELQLVSSNCAGEPTHVTISSRHLYSIFAQLAITTPD
jgi:hypothetical protein